MSCLPAGRLPAEVCVRESAADERVASRQQVPATRHYHAISGFANSVVITGGNRHT